jgi:hypothetical protein
LVEKLICRRDVSLKEAIKKSIGETQAVATKTKTQTNAECAVDVWSVLTRQAQERKVSITYAELNAEVGHGSAKLGSILEYIFQYCKFRRLPKLTILALKKAMKKPASEIDPHTEVDYREVYNYDWQSLPTPTAAEFEEAMVMSKDDTVELKFQKIRAQIVPYSHKSEG